MHTGNAASILVGTSSWREQFREALTVSAGKDPLLMGVNGWNFNMNLEILFR